MNIFIPILKVDAARREVYGVMAEEALDKSNEIFDYESSKPYVKAWVEEFQKATDGKSCGNVRVQHGKVAAGKLVGVTFDDDAKRIPVVAKIVDDNEWKKVEEGVYTGFSIGGSYVKRWADGTAIRYTAQPREVSIVDNPCMYGAKFTMVKSNGAVEEKNFHAGASNVHALLEGLLKMRAASGVATTAAPGARFIPGGMEKSGVAEMELLKARSNRRPIWMP